MNSDSEIRARYLSLALDARSLVDQLKSFIEQGQKNRDLENSLSNMLSSIGKDQPLERYFAPLEGGKTLTYEQYRILDEVNNTMLDKNIAQRLTEVLAPGRDMEEQRRSAHEVFTFFYVAQE